MSADTPFEAVGGQGRAVPFHCPYCAEEDLIPEEEPAGAWLCAGCRRVFVVRMVGLRPRGGAGPSVAEQDRDGRSPEPTDTTVSAAGDSAGQAGTNDTEPDRGQARREARSSG
ncbi:MULTISPECIES: hypothetical protein [Actinoalloteichus]|uniref:Insertion element protein n=1 Tax=Actinoalloteichus fjordicus TaxID=1612552 RepID=A0AAC9LHC7_9PSEU|nr:MULTISPECIES: hypothetical protein [Actinoalloteichus]APU16920.1 hypothetical protein UA74_24530 [Actinoalloteichus fjordicus]APU23000.1 hypothetical protein UA75_25110 [Actinoalloteichus sp. GBA129-24]